MSLKLKLLTLFLSTIFLFVFFKMVKNRSVKPFYSFLWLIISIFMFTLVIFEKIYKFFANFLGITDASFLIIVFVLFFLLIYIFYLSIKISELSDRIQELISFTAILEKKIRDKK